MFPKLAFLLVLGVALELVNADAPERIVGGSNATLGQLPYQVSLQLDGGHFCGGTLISTQHVLTAAHCVTDVGPPFLSLTVVTGTVTLNEGGQRHKVKDVKFHPKFNVPAEEPASFGANDVALITLEAPIQETSYQRHIPVATSDPPTDATLVISGWGATETGYPNELQVTVVRAVDHDECQRIHNSVTLLPTQICTLNRHGIGACMGDSGGPLVYNGEVVGIASWVIPCALGIPDVYTRPNHFIDFINTAAGYRLY